MYFYDEELLAPRPTLKIEDCTENKYRENFGWGNLLESICLEDREGDGRTALM
jgi:hypothetical protein